jgi:hypothetical protein
LFIDKKKGQLMNANTVYDIFLALPERKRQRHIELNEVQQENRLQKFHLTQNKEKAACLY